MENLNEIQKDLCVCVSEFIEFHFIMDFEEKENEN